MASGSDSLLAWKLGMEALRFGQRAMSMFKGRKSLCKGRGSIEALSTGQESWIPRCLVCGAGGPALQPVALPRSLEGLPRSLEAKSLSMAWLPQLLFGQRPQ